MAAEADEVNADLSKERATSSFDVEEFAVWWADGKEKLDKQRSMQRIFFEDSEFDDVTNVSYLSHVELYEYSVEKAMKYLRKLQKVVNVAEPIVIDDEMLYNFRMTFMSGLIGVALFPMGFPLRLHYSMFMQTILRQGTEEQRNEWLPKCWRCEMIGTYAQTELGHGTNIRGLETRADYDQKTEEFVLNTPTLSSYKWWPGQMGHTTNFTILMAQLHVGGTNYGVHPFLLQIRDLETHMPLPGVEVGEIGPKMALNGFNNGYLALKNVRIPRLHMLMRNATVAADGAYKRHGDLTLAYSSMVFMRVMMVRDASFNISQAATIATRYSAVRRQSPIEPNEPEPQILDHVTQQMKLFPQIAKAVVFKLAADHVWEMYRKVMDGEDQASGLSELHALTCCLKAVCTADALASVEVLRLACGGQGFLASSNLPNIYGSAAPACTYEGENTVILLQTARFLMKAWRDVLSGKQLPSTVSYLSSYNKQVKWFRSLDRAMQVLQTTAANKIRQTYEFMEERIKRGYSQQAAANFSGIRLTQAATLHTRAYLATSAYEQIRNQTKDLPPALAKALWNLLEIFILDTVLSNLGDILNCVSISAEEVATVQLRLETLLSWMRPNAVAIVDGFDLHDRILNSTLGAYDGRVYERLLQEARKSPLNQQPVNHSFHKYLKPFMRGKL